MPPRGPDRRRPPYYQSALAAHPEDPGALRYLGVIALGHDQLQEAAALMDRALAQKPDSAEYLANRGVVAHLAGALGKPVWVLLAAQPDWRWGKDRADSVWYPSARVFRQSTLGDWRGVVAELEAALSGASR
ncbi:tetratricopeptide repeat protein [Paraburkholderia nodosa]|uniref:tetratricopeptide repeat protein n=1 Tax=Paraburkholderia nodosa TaxID=392320 RepID=UPI00084211A8|nr:tetratricopeptide repeat protein [Paraburkholderia nodosa]